MNAKKKSKTNLKHWFLEDLHEIYPPFSSFRFFFLSFSFLFDWFCLTLKSFRLFVSFKEFLETHLGLSNGLNH